MVDCQISNSHTLKCENTHYSTVRIQDSTRFIVENSIVLVIEPQIEPQICAGGINDVIWLRLDAKIVDKHQALQTAA